MDRFNLARMALALGLAAGVLAAGEAMATERPKYEVLKRYEGFEVREYASYVVAETVVKANRQDAGNEGFRRLAGYIFGKNRGGQKIAMTAPVTEAPAEGTRIAMTAPVTEAAVEEGFAVQFMMPSGYTLESLPSPIDDRVVFRQVPARQVAALRYSGTWSESRYQEHLDKLRGELKKQGLEEKGDASWARYDPPWTPWFLRTNEILIPVGQP